MNILLIIFMFAIAIWILIKTIVYGIYEFQKCKNTFGGSLVIALSIISFVGFSVLIFLMIV